METNETVVTPRTEIGEGIIPSAGTAVAGAAKKISLADAIKKKSLIKFSFDLVDALPSNTDKNVTIAILRITSDPIPVVMGSQKMQDQDTGLYTIDMEAEDVDTIRVSSENFNDDFKVELDEDGNVAGGEYEGSKLSFDISKSTGDVWLVSEKFSVFGNKKRQENRGTRNGSVIAKLKQRS